LKIINNDVYNGTFLNIHGQPKGITMENQCILTGLYQKNISISVYDEFYIVGDLNINIKRLRIFNLPRIIILNEGSYPNLDFIIVKEKKECVLSDEDCYADYMQEEKYD